MQITTNKTLINGNKEDNEKNMTKNATKLVTN